VKTQTHYARTQPPHLKAATWDTDIVINIWTIGFCFVLGVVFGVIAIVIFR
jgi:hypothetical protein